MRILLANIFLSAADARARSSAGTSSNRYEASHGFRNKSSARYPAHEFSGTLGIHEVAMFSRYFLDLLYRAVKSTPLDAKSYIHPLFAIGSENLDQFTGSRVGSAVEIFAAHGQDSVVDRRKLISMVGLRHKRHRGQDKAVAD